MFVRPKRLKKGGTIMIIAPAYKLTEQEGKKAAAEIEQLGFKVKFGKNTFLDTDKYAATALERAEDFNAAIKDESVDMLLFSGGEVSLEILELIDYGAILKNKKIICSYSDSTSVLCAVTSMSGLVTFYGMSPSALCGQSEYNTSCFERAFLQADCKSHIPNSKWVKINGGTAYGCMIGGYLLNFALFCTSKYFTYNKDQKYILFLEDNIRFNKPAAVSRYFSYIEQSGFFKNVSGLIWGHYALSEYSEVDNILSRIAKAYNIPVVKTDDFGHGANRAVLPIGIEARLDVDKMSLQYTQAFTEKKSK